MTEVQPPLSMEDGCYTAIDDRRLVGGLVCSEGVTNLASDLIVEDSPSGGLRVQVRAGSAFIQSDFTANDGMYYVFNDNPVTILLETADATFPRTDLIIAQVRDSTYGGTDNDWLLTYVKGTASAGAPAPYGSVPDTAIVLAEVRVNAGDTELSSGDITDVREHYQLCTDSMPEPPFHGWLATVTYTTSGTFIKANYPGAQYIKVRMVGGGGGGAASGAADGSSGSGGGGGGYAEETINVASLSGTTVVTVGTGGQGQVAEGALAASSTGSAFGGFLSASGGGQGTTHNPGGSTAIGGAGGTGTGGSLNISGERGGSAYNTGSLAYGGGGGDSQLGRGASERIALDGDISAGLGSNPYGGGGSGAASAVASSGQAGGDGADGVVIVEVYA